MPNWRRMAEIVAILTHSASSSPWDRSSNGCQPAGVTGRLSLSHSYRCQGTSTFQQLGDTQFPAHSQLCPFPGECMINNPVRSAGLTISS